MPSHRFLPLVLLLAMLFALGFPSPGDAELPRPGQVEVKGGFGADLPQGRLNDAADLGLGWGAGLGYCLSRHLIVGVEIGGASFLPPDFIKTNADIDRTVMKYVVTTKYLIFTPGLFNREDIGRGGLEGLYCEAWAGRQTMKLKLNQPGPSSAEDRSGLALGLGFGTYAYTRSRLPGFVDRLGASAGISYNVMYPETPNTLYFGDEAKHLGYLEIAVELTLLLGAGRSD